MEWLSDGVPALLPPLVGWLVAPGADLGLQLALTGAQSVALTWSRRFPLTVLGASVALELMLILVKMPVLVAPLVAASRLGAWGRGAHRVIGVAAVLALLGIGLPVTLVSLGDPVRVVVTYAAAAVLVVGFWAMGRLDGRRRDRIHELQARSRRLEAERELAERRAAERERTLLARELHDILNHSITTMVVDAEAGADTRDDMEETLRRVARTGRESLAELRRLLGVLRQAPPGHDPLAPPPRLEHLDALVAAIPPGGPRATLTRSGAVRQVDTSIELAAYRVVQEALTNVAKHAGPVDVRVLLHYDATRLTVTITNPVTSRPIGTAGGVGLVGMRERVGLLGGSVQVRAGRETFEVRATLPLREVP
ncbi:sensor histidine kinase [Nonomuraea angiospora]|uniref:histidine kinase n=1 Tax=Nonomuraea angiospora TaxID=46172 RepID=A0ABR9MLC9_9ACTN|nr:histidine kinase [Nonomuraea angiospora]MBE1593262.1 signal transduction histidine kinase [Nonomuraea angiospora]